MLPENQETITEDGATITKCKDNMNYSSINIDEYVTEDKIYYGSGANKGYFTYKINENNYVSFNADLTITNGISYDQYEQITENLNAVIPFSIIAMINGVSFDKALSYFSSISFVKALEKLGESGDNGTTRAVMLLEDGVEASSGDSDTLVIKKSEFASHAVEYATIARGIQSITIDDSDQANTFRYSVTVDTSDASKYVEKHSITVKGDADYSQVGNSNILGGDISRNSVDPTTGTVNETENDISNNPDTGSFVSIIMIASLIILLPLTIIIRKKLITQI